MLFLVQLIPNAAWSWLFFGIHLLGLPFVEILVLLSTIQATTIAFWSSSLAAGLLMLPYSRWVGFVAAPNFTTWRLNARAAICLPVT